MRKNFIYIDDESVDETGVFAQLLNKANKNIKVTLMTPLPFAEQIAYLRNNRDKFDGLILDLRLDQVANNNKRAEYRALTLAQELRTRITEGTFPAKTMVLCSTDSRLNQSYRKDESGHDLFEIKFLKTDIVRDAKTVALKLEALANGYQSIIKIKNKISGRGEYLHEFFNIKKDDSIKLDKRLLNYFGTGDGKMPEHEYARLLLKEMIEVPGVLINEAYLAARLGIDIAQSKDWNSLKKTALNKFLYTGPFHEGWPRWWMYQLTDWWCKFKNMPSDLPYLLAEERVAFLKTVTKLPRLVAAQPLKKNYSTSFWTICQGFDSPLDPIDGFIIDGKTPLPWQEKQYMSAEAALRRLKYREGLRVHPFEETRLKDLRDALK